MILVDSSIWIDFLIDPDRVPEAQSRILDFVTCGLVIQEVLQGFDDSPVRHVFERKLLTFPRLSDPLPVTQFLAAAEIYREGRRKGFTIRSTMDCLIASIAIENNVPVWHRDRDFTAIAKYTSLRVFSQHLT